MGLWVAVGGAVLTVAASGALGAIALALSAAALMLIGAHQAIGRHVPALGTVSVIALVGLVWTLANPRMLYPWPVLLAMTHVGVCRSVVHSLGTSRPRLSARGVVLALVVLGWFSLALLAVQAARQGDVDVAAWDAVRGARDGAWLGPALAGLGMAIGGVGYVLRSRRNRSSAARTPRRETSTPHRAATAASAVQWRGLLLYDAGWLAATVPWATPVPAVLLGISLLRAWRRHSGGRGTATAA